MALIVSLYWDEDDLPKHSSEIDFEDAQILVYSIEEPTDHIMRWESVKMPWDRGDDDSES